MEMKKVYLQGRYLTSINYYKQLINDNLKLNWTLVEDPNDCDYFLSFDSVSIRSKKTDAKYFLIRSEPIIILPWCYSKKNCAQFDLIIDVGKPQRLGLNVVPQPQNISILNRNQSCKENRLVIINSNLLSFRSGELYSLRRAAIFNLDFIDLYGHGWNISLLSKIKNVSIEFYRVIKYPTRLNLRGIKLYFRNIKWYGGAIENKFEVLSNYKYTLVIENTKGYLSEKLFDALVSGCIPIYVGEDLGLFNIPEGLVIQSKANIDSVLHSYELAKKLDYEQWRRKCLDWLENANTIDEWSYSSFIPNIRDCIEKMDFRF
jgi:hypothetical protein